jgi:hypothetical protein
LGGEGTLKWKISEKRKIIFELQARVTGWLGFSLGGGVITYS